MSAPRITADMLADKKACADQVETFRKLFPRGTPVTLAAAKRCVKAGLDLDWFAQAFLPPKAYADYLAKRAPLLADYLAKRHTLLVRAYRAAGKASGGAA